MSLLGPFQGFVVYHGYVEQSLKKGKCRLGEV